MKENKGFSKSRNSRVKTVFNVIGESGVLPFRPAKCSYT